MNRTNNKLGSKSYSALYEAFEKQGKVEGVDHICIDRNSSSAVGRYTCLDKKKDFFIPNLGNFTSVNTFLSWMHTGNEMYRHKECFLGRQIFNNVLYKKAAYFAKYHQMLSVKSLFIKSKDTLILPWFEYKLYPSGIREYSKDPKRASVLKSMVEHIISGSNSPFSCEEFDYVKDSEMIMNHIRNKFNVVVPETSKASISEPVKKDNVKPKKKHTKKHVKKTIEPLENKTDTNLHETKEEGLNIVLEVSDTTNCEKQLSGVIEQQSAE